MSLLLREGEAMSGVGNPPPHLLVEPRHWAETLNTSGRQNKTMRLNTSSQTTPLSCC